MYFHLSLPRHRLKHFDWSLDVDLWESVNVSLPSCNTTITKHFYSCIVIICPENKSAMFSPRNARLFTESSHTKALRPLAWRWMNGHARALTDVKWWIINNLLTSNVRLLREISNIGLVALTSLSLGQYGKASVWDFPVTTSLSVLISHYENRTMMIVVRYCYYFVAHCGAFCGQKWRVWRAKMCFSPLK